MLIITQNVEEMKGFISVYGREKMVIKLFLNYIKYELKGGDGLARLRWLVTFPVLYLKFFKPKIQNKHKCVIAQLIPYRLSAHGRICHNKITKKQTKV